MLNAQVVAEGILQKGDGGKWNPLMLWFIIIYGVAASGLCGGQAAPVEWCRLIVIDGYKDRSLGFSNHTLNILSTINI